MSCWGVISACKWNDFEVSISIIDDDNLHTNQITDTFEKSSSSSCLNPFMANMFNVQPPMILSLQAFMKTANYGLSSKVA